MPSVLLITFVLGIYVQLICSESFSIVLSLISLSCTTQSSIVPAEAPCMAYTEFEYVHQFKSMCGVFSCIFSFSENIGAPHRRRDHRCLRPHRLIIVFYSLQYAGQGRNVEYSSQHHLLISIALLLWTSCYDYSGIIVVSSFKYICILFACLFVYLLFSLHLILFLCRGYQSSFLYVLLVHHQYMLSSHTRWHARTHADWTCNIETHFILSFTLPPRMVLNALVVV